MKPMLAATIKDLYSIKYPVLVSPKYDGIRAIVVDGVVMSRAMKPIPNKFVQHLFGRTIYNGLDGELIVGPSTAKDVFNKTTSGVMSRDGEPDVRFFIFDYVVNESNDPYSHRFSRIRAVADLYNTDASRIWLVDQATCENVSQAEQQEIWMLQDGYEGMMVRSIHGLYKHGRSTLKEGHLMKLKRFSDGEAEVVGMTELMHNANPAKTNELGHKERSNEKRGMVGMKTMGSLIVRDIKTGVQFEIGTGFTAVDRVVFWKLHKSRRPDVLVVKYKFQEVGVKDKPRFPVYLGLRDRRDMS